jgi:HEAT repeat protein
MSALKVVANQGEACVVELAARKSADPDIEMRRASVDLLGRVAGRGDPAAMSVATVFLKDSDMAIRQTALDAISKLAVKGDPQVIASIGETLEDSEEAVRHSAVDTLGLIATKGDAAAIAVVTARLSHRFWWVRRAAIKALDLVAERDDSRVTSAVVLRLADNDPKVRLVALDVLPQVVEPGNEQAISAIWSLLDRHVRNMKPTSPDDKPLMKAALQALGKIGRGRRCPARMPLAPRRGGSRSSGQGSEEARVTAVDALSCLVEWADERALAVICEHLENGDSALRCAAMAALQRLAKAPKRGKSPGAEKVVDHRQSQPDRAVRQAARQVGLAAFDELVGKGERNAVTAVHSLLNDQNVHVRRSVVLSLVRAAEPPPLEPSCAKHFAEEQLGGDLPVEEQPEIEEPSELMSPPTLIVGEPPCLELPASAEPGHSSESLVEDSVMSELTLGTELSTVDSREGRANAFLEVSSEVGEHLAHAALVQLLKAKDSRVRQAACSALVEAADTLKSSSSSSTHEEVDAGARHELKCSRISESAQKLTHEDGDVRKKASRALMKWATGEGSKPSARRLAAIVTFAKAILRHRDVGVRRMALDLLEAASPRGDIASVAEIGHRLADADWSVRKAAVRTMAKLAPMGHEAVIKALGACLSDRSVHVRRAAVEAFGVVASKGSRFAISEASARLEHRHWSVRWSAVGALMRIGAPRSEEGSTQDVLADLRARLHHKNLRVREVAAHALSGLTASGAASAASLVDFAFETSKRLLRKEQERVLWTQRQKLRKYLKKDNEWIAPMTSPLISPMSPATTLSCPMSPTMSVRTRAYSRDDSKSVRSCNSRAGSPDASPESKLRRLDSRAGSPDASPESKLRRLESRAGSPDASPESKLRRLDSRAGSPDASPESKLKRLEITPTKYVPLPSPLSDSAKGVSPGRLKRRPFQATTPRKRKARKLSRGGC